MLHVHEPFHFLATFWSLMVCNWNWFVVPQKVFERKMMILPSMKINNAPSCFENKLCPSSWIFSLVQCIGYWFKYVVLLEISIIYPLILEIETFYEIDMSIANFWIHIYKRPNYCLLVNHIEYGMCTAETLISLSVHDWFICLLFTKCCPWRQLLIWLEWMHTKGVNPYYILYIHKSEHFGVFWMA